MKNNIHILALALCASTAYGMEEEPGTHNTQAATSPQMHKSIPTLLQLAGTAARPQILQKIKDKEAFEGCVALIAKNPKLECSVASSYILERTLDDHTDRVCRVAYNADYTQLAAGADSGTIKLWDLRTGLCQQTLNGHTERITSLTYNLNGTQFASGADSGTIKLWDLRTGLCQQTLNGHTDTIIDLGFYFYSQLASLSQDRFIQIWNTVSGQCQHTIDDHTENASDLAHNPDGTQLAPGSSDYTMKIWGSITGRYQETHTDFIARLSFEGQPASGLSDYPIKILNTASGQCQQTLKGHTKRIVCLTCNPDGTQFASGSYDETIKLWRKATVTEQLIMDYMKHHKLTTREQLPAHMQETFDTIPEQSRNWILKYGLQNDEQTT